MRGDLEAKVAIRGRCARELVQGDLAEGRVREDPGPNPAASTLVMSRRPSCAVLEDVVQEHAADELLNGT